MLPLLLSGRNVFGESTTLALFSKLRFGKREWKPSWMALDACCEPLMTKTRPTASWQKPAGKSQGGAVWFKTEKSDTLMTFKTVPGLIGVGGGPSPY